MFFHNAAFAGEVDAPLRLRIFARSAQEPLLQPVSGEIDADLSIIDMRVKA
jgi:hypothetical protein